MGILSRASIAVKKNLRNIYLDYFDTYKDLRRNVRNRPLKASLYGCLGLFGVQLFRTNEDIDSYRSDMVDACSRMFALTENSRNPVSYKFVQDIGELNYSRCLRHLDLCFASIIYKADCNPDVALYRFNCPYLKPSIKEFFRDRIVDFGLLGHWFILELKMKDYDINDKEYEGLAA